VWRSWVRVHWCARTLGIAGMAIVCVCWLAQVAQAAGLPDGRGYELVSPAEKAGNDVIGTTSRIHAADGLSPSLPAAITFASFGAFGDVQGTGIAAEYMAQRDGGPGTQGWSTHAITPRQEPLSFIAASEAHEPLYDGEMAGDLTKGVFRAWSPLSDDPNVQGVVNLYARTDLRTPGDGTYQLLTNSIAPLPPLAPNFGINAQVQRPSIAGTSDDFRHVLFESGTNLTADATGGNVKLYKSDDGIVRMISDGSGACPGAIAGPSTIPAGATPVAPCAIAGLGVNDKLLTPRVISADGSRVNFTAPVRSGGSPTVTGSLGIASRLYQFDDRGTAATNDDVTIEVSASEKSSSDVTQAATYQTASTDGSRVFFASGEQLTDTPGGGLYMWERQPANETQSVAVDATGGTFTLTAHTQPTACTGTLTNGSTVVTGVRGSFSVGQTIKAVTGVGIAPGTTVTAAAVGRLALSAPATADASGVALTASVDATTGPLAADASAAQVQAALEGLRAIGTGNVTVRGPPQAYEVTFVGALAGIDVARLSADASALSGGGASVRVTVSTPVHNLTLIAPGAGGVLGASTDGHRIYFVAGSGLVPNTPDVPQNGLYLWQDAEGSPNLAFIGGVPIEPQLVNHQWGLSPLLSRVTSDGRHLAFITDDGSNLRPRTQQPGAQVYVYSADSSTPTDPDLVCASCDPSVPQTLFQMLWQVEQGLGATQKTPHYTRTLSDDGRRVFFSTDDPLVPEDVNGKVDAYEFDVATSTVHLLSSGADPSDSFFMDSSASGNDAYFVTRQQLVGWDRDSAYDLYDARVGGGFPNPPAPPIPCVDDACQGQPASPPAVALMGGSSFRGLGNLPVTHAKRHMVRRCRRGRVRKRVHGRVRCVKRKHRAKHTSVRGVR
jgi:hypothetical protein